MAPRRAPVMAFRRKKRQRDPSMPKAPAGGGYGVFLAENRVDITNSLPAGSKITDVSKEAGRKWKEMSEDDKAPYQQKYQAAKEAFTTAMAEYKAARPAEETPTKRSRKDEPNSASKHRREAKEASVGPEELAKQAKARRALHARAQRLGMLPQLLMMSRDPEIVSLGVSERKILKVLESKYGIAEMARSELFATAAVTAPADPEQEVLKEATPAEVQEAESKAQAMRMVE